MDRLFFINEFILREDLIYKFGYKDSNLLVKFNKMLITNHHLKQTDLDSLNMYKGLELFCGKRLYIEEVKERVGRTEVRLQLDVSIKSYDFYFILNKILLGVWQKERIIVGIKFLENQIELRLKSNRKVLGMEELKGNVVIILFVNGFRQKKELQVLLSGFGVLQNA